MNMAIIKNKPETREEAVLVLSRMVGKLASKWARNHRQDYNDIYNEGMIGVLEAYNKYDPKHGAAFSSYAYLWARHYVRQYALKSWNTKNNTAAMDYSDYNLGTVEYDNIDSISIEKQIKKQPKDVQKIFNLRKEGYNFREIAEMEGYPSLHKVRNKFMEACEKLEA